MIAWFSASWTIPQMHAMEIGTDGDLSTVLLSDPVLVYTDESEIRICRYEQDPDTGFMGFVEEDGAQPTVTHWMPLPKPPREDRP